MNKHVLGVALLSALGLTACGDGPTEPQIPDGASVGQVTYTKPLFSPATGKLPAPNDILFSGTTDLTLRQSGVTSDREGSTFPANEVYVDPNPLNSNAAFAANHVFGLDGWSAVAPFVINFTNDDRVTKIDASSVVGGQTVRVYRVNTARPVDPNTGVYPPSGPVVGIQSELRVGVDYRVDMVPVAEQATRTDGPSGTLRITPINPLAENGSYLVVLTKGIKDTRGLNIISDSQYEGIKGTTPIESYSPFAALEPLRKAINPALTALEALGLSRNNVALTMQFNVQGVGDVFSTLSQIVNNPAAPAPASGSFTTIVPSIHLLNPALSSNAALFQGSLTVPYYLSAPSGSKPLAPLKEFWRASSASPLGTNLSYINKLPVKTGDEIIPVLVTIPSAANCTKPSTGWPVTIFQHGITRNRTDMLPIANTLASAGVCIATVAIDMPLHGLLAAADYTSSTDQGLASLLHAGYTPGARRERIFGVDYVNNTTGAAGPDGKVDASGAHFINLTSALTSRDNLREAAADLLVLSRALTAMDVDGGGADFDANKVYFVGHSLGAITGSNFVSYDPRVKASVLVAPGGGLGKMVPASLAFGPTINGGLASVGRNVGTAGYEDFVFALQTVIDQGDPLSNWEAFRANTKPSIMMQVANDLVVPNDVSNLNYAVPAGSGLPTTVPVNAPYAGTTPLARAFGLANIGATTMNANGVRGFVRFNTGCHGSLLSPATCAPAVTDPTVAGRVTVEMNKVIATYLASSGTAVVFADTALIVP